MQMTIRRHLTGAMLASAVAAALVLGVQPASAQISVVVAAGNNVAVTATQASDMFGGVRTVWPSGAKVQIVDQAGTATGRAFYIKCVKRPPTIVHATWTRLSLSGQAIAPKTAASDADVKEAVRKLPGAIGYIASSSLDDTVREVCRIE
jgi:hypothetical protein